MTTSRILDANINRCAEGLRVLEDIARFRFNAAAVSADLRRMRHQIRQVFKGQETGLIHCRNAKKDVGRSISAAQTTDQRRDLTDTVLSNFKRVQEALRTLEEILKTRGDYAGGKQMETWRFDVYTLETDFFNLFKKQLPKGIYGILGEKFSRGKTNIQVARQMVDAGIDVLQYREKPMDKTRRQMFEECRAIRKITWDANVPFIVNDDVDLALMVGADGIHQGQDDLPIDQIRRIAPDMMIGCSTHSPAQAAQAVADGADYIGVGPIFTTRTKADVCDAVGLGYLEHVVARNDIPFVAIGGIKLNNIQEVISKGASTICLVTEIIGAEDIGQTIRKLKQILGATQ